MESRNVVYAVTELGLLVSFACLSVGIAADPSFDGPWEPVHWCVVVTWALNALVALICAVQLFRRPDPAVEVQRMVAKMHRADREVTAMIVRAHFFPAPSNDER